MTISNSPFQRKFRLKHTFWLSITAGVLILLISIFHILFQSKQIGFGALAVSIGLLLTSWHCYKKTYNSTYTFLLLIPFATFFVAYQIVSIGISFSFWCYPTVLLFYFVLTEHQARISNFLFVAVSLPLAWNLFDTPEAIRFSVTLIIVSVYAAIFLRVISGQNEELSQMVITDTLTGLYNRSLLKDSLEQAIHLSNRADTSYTLITLDIDHFKRINDDLGHEMGDQVLIGLSTFLKSFFRDSDRVFRIGGEEFLILVHNSDQKCSIKLAEKLRVGVENLQLLPNRSITVSVGVAEKGSEQDWKKWMRTCDMNLYKAKNSGRNKVVPGIPEVQDAEEFAQD